MKVDVNVERIVPRAKDVGKAALFHAGHEPSNSVSLKGEDIDERLRILSKMTR